MLYWICLTVGGTVLLFSLLSGHDHDVDHPSWGETLGLLNLRALVSALAFFGLGGVIAGLIGLSGSGRLLFAAAAGVSVGAFTGWLFAFARRGELETREGSLVGRTGKVLVAPRGQRPGKVLLNLAGQSSEVLALSPESLQVGEAVIVVAAEAGQVDVRRWDGRP